MAVQLHRSARRQPATDQSTTGPITRSAPFDMKPVNYCDHHLVRPDDVMAEGKSSQPNGADFCLCRKYRYRLWRTWGVPDQPTKRLCLFILLNPSTADERADDRTVQRCRAFAQSWGFGGMDVVNLFAFRSTDPTALRGVPDPIGPSNDAAILSALQRAEQVVCAWGGHGTLHNRGAAVMRMLQGKGVEAFCFGRTRTGQPVHPSRLRHTSSLTRCIMLAGASSMEDLC